jgi:hypothetical protein
VFPLNLYAHVRISLCIIAHETAGAASTRLSLRHLSSEAQNDRSNPGAIAPRERDPLTVACPFLGRLAGRNISALAKAALKGEKTMGKRNASGEQFDHQGQGLHCRDL